MTSYLGPYPLDDIYCGDSAVMLAALPDGCIDLTVTSPPYDDMDDDFNPIPARGLRQYNGYTWDFKELARDEFLHFGDEEAALGGGGAAVQDDRQRVNRFARNHDVQFDQITFS